MNKRLFLVAGYDAKNCVDASLVYLVRALSQYGDVVLYMDGDVKKSELKKIIPFVLHADAARHGEYDFGSYRRAYTYARDTAILDKYKYVYMANDSVYGPLYDLGPILKKMESANTDAFGLVFRDHKSRPHIQSWFFGMTACVFKSDWFDAFITSVTKQPDKGAITYLYEQGFTRALNAHKIKYYCPWHVHGRDIYNKIKSLYRRGLPFMKKVAFIRHNGALGRQILYVLSHIPSVAHTAILENANRTYGADYVKWLLTRNPIKIGYRNIKNIINKIF